MAIQRLKIAVLGAILLLTIPASQAGILHSDKVLLLCHRTANRDLPENTLESLALAARMGCDVVEIDVRRTADGVLVLNHDGLLDRFSDTTGQIEDTDLSELDQMDFGAWMGERFRCMHLARFDDALHLARELRIGLSRHQNEGHWRASPRRARKGANDRPGSVWRRMGRHSSPRSGSQ